MQALKRYVTSSIGRKQLMGLSGIALYGFLFFHLLGNLGLLAGPEHFNRYGHLLLDILTEVVVPAELGLVAAFILHVYLAISLTIENRRARPQGYAVRGGGGRKTLYSATMMVTGVLILFFVFIHIAHFRFQALSGPRTATYDGVEMTDIYYSALHAFSHWWYAGAYVAVFLLIFSHLAHGVQSSLQTLGFNHPKYRAAVHWAGRGYAVLISGGFSFLAIWGYFQGGAS
jgi:succinate dehydrogenase / fumarate reductase, cytochrome b subunit